ncbi:N-acetylmuramoyl-L-alanine amidase [Streptomyces griseorubiginosus]|uniref:N-acetylmuramoyl-L-alanine amidase n=1 Tax=Streptomyces griseorubiginosus TaxID=67304 RepID=UPI002E81C399|nr:N-acetylmuramoyl-L-alanine amidase [Streptomyces griseorubiginosus]WUB41878.1 N-acetylmuramoyl-L-alanine amidase [Streptomyces griseorubiginosus]WUB50398.1 N-acetylmuramoyl-L-alanine amidase [Streptomyces griseorubiginosus]
MTDPNPAGARRPARPVPLVPRRVFLGALGVAGALSVVPRLPAAAAASAAYTLRSRAAWGADETLRYTAGGTEIWPPEYYPVQTLTVHHTDDGSTDPDPAAVVRAIYRNDTVGKGYGDIGYNFLIDRNGLVYEGRWSGTDGTAAHDATGRMVTGAHVQGYNSGNLGIALLGTFTTTPPTTAARTALVQLLADLVGRHALVPAGKVLYRNPVSGVTRAAPVIGGHLDWAATDCPGTVWSHLPAIRAEVAALIPG